MDAQTPIKEKELPLIDIPQDRGLTEDDLPTQEQLKVLLEKRGKDALVCYAWRNALRVLPLLGQKPMQNVWPNNNVIKHCFAVQRVNILLQNAFRKNRPKVDFFSASASSAASASAASDAARAVRRFNDDKLTNVFYSQAITDFNLLLTGESPNLLLSAGVWLEHANIINANLQESHLFDIAEVIEQFHQRQARFYQALNEIGLGFVVEDLKQLYAGDLISEPRFQLYVDSLKYSEDILNDADKLAAVFGGVKTQENRAVRVLLVGPGGAGKSSLFELLTKRKVKVSGDATISIDTGKVDLPLHKENGVNIKDSELDISLWDFGGQSVFYNLHRGFMRRENCVYVLVVDSRHEQAPDDWLGQISEHTRTGSSQTSDKAKVIIVTNAYDQIHREQNQAYLKRKFGDALDIEAFCTFNCTNAEDKDGHFNQFVAQLVATSAKSQRRILSTTRAAIDKFTQVFEKDDFVEIAVLAKLLNLDSDSEEFQSEQDSLENLGGYCPQW